jgi:hypothetical protein
MQIHCHSKVFSFFRINSQYLENVEQMPNSVVYLLRAYNLTTRSVAKRSKSLKVCELGVRVPHAYIHTFLLFARISLHNVTLPSLGRLKSQMCGTLGYSPVARCCWSPVRSRVGHCKFVAELVKYGQRLSSVRRLVFLSLCYPRLFWCRGRFLVFPSHSTFFQLPFSL